MGFWLAEGARDMLAERVGFEPTCPLTQARRFRGAPVMTTSVPLREKLSSWIRCKGHGIEVSAAYPLAQYLAS
jgi:hypothetical protein